MNKVLFLSLIGIMFLIVACESTEEGCLDIRSANFDVNAVMACDSCCVLPTARLDVDLVFDTFDFNFGTQYQLSNGDTFRLRSLRLPFSDFTFRNAIESYQVQDTMLNVEPRTTDDYFIVESSSIATIGFTDFVDRIDSVDCIVGYDRDDLESLQPFIDLHPTVRALEVINRFYVDSTDIYFQAEMSVEIADSVRQLQISNIKNPNLLLAYEVPIEPVLGLPWAVPIVVDVNKMMVGIDSTQTNEMMAETIGCNISAAISSN